MNRFFFMLAIVLTIIMTINGLQGVTLGICNDPQKTSEPWKCGDKVREIPTIELGGKCWMNANIGYSKHNYGAYYTWKEALTVCDSVFGDGWTLPTKSDATAIATLSPAPNNTWEYQPAGYLDETGKHTQLPKYAVYSDDAYWVNVNTENHTATWTSTAEENSGYIISRTGQQVKYGAPGQSIAYPCYSNTSRYKYPRCGGGSDYTSSMHGGHLRTSTQKMPQTNALPVRCVRKL